MCWLVKTAWVGSQVCLFVNQLGWVGRYVARLISRGRQAGYVGLSISWDRLVHWSINEAGQVGRLCWLVN